MLYFISRSAEVSINGEVLLATAGDVVIINSNNIHYIKLQGEECQYYCLIMDHNFCRIFKDITGQTLKGYLLTLRCLHARTLLQKGNINIAEGALMCGFNNSSYFSKCYKS